MFVTAFLKFLILLILTRVAHRQSPRRRENPVFLKELFIVMIHLHLITRVENQAATIQEIIAHRLNVVFGEAFHIRKHDRGVLG